MISLLTSRFGIAGIAALALVLMFAAWQVQVSNVRSAATTAISAEKDKTRTVQGQFDSYKLEVEQAITDQANIRLAEAAKQADDQAKLQEANDRLRASYAASTKERNDLSAELLRRLNNAPKTPESALDAGTREYYGRLRDAQLTAASATSDQATRGSPNGLSVPAPAP